MDLKLRHAYVCLSFLSLSLAACGFHERDDEGWNGGPGGPPEFGRHHPGHGGGSGADCDGGTSTGGEPDATTTTPPPPPADSGVSASPDATTAPAPDAGTSETPDTGTSSGGPDAGPSCNPTPGAIYLSSNPAVCASITFTCPEGQERFDDPCGCGCATPPPPPPDAGPACPDPADPRVTYVNNDPAICAQFEFTCTGSCVRFDSPCGCGCITP